MWEPYSIEYICTRKPFFSSNIFSCHHFLTFVELTKRCLLKQGCSETLPNIQRKQPKGHLQDTVCDPLPNVFYIFARQWVELRLVVTVLLWPPESLSCSTAHNDRELIHSWSMCCSCLCELLNLKFKFLFNFNLHESAEMLTNQCASWVKIRQRE